VSVLWRGNWATRTRIASGLVLFTYALLHFLNIGLGLISPYWMEHAQTWRQLVTRSLPGEIVLYGAMMAHAGLAIVGLAGRRTLRMPLWEAVQIGLGLIIPLMLMEHIVHTRVAHQTFGVNDDFGYILALIWGSPDAAAKPAVAGRLGAWLYWSAFLAAQHQLVAAIHPVSDRVCGVGAGLCLCRVPDRGAAHHGGLCQPRHARPVDDDL